MRSHSGSISVATVSLALVLLFFFSPIVYASQSTQSYAAYRITLTNGNVSKSFTVNETVQPSSASGFSILTISLAGANENLTYSKVVNSSSSLLFPILPVSNNQSIIYQNRNYSVRLSIDRTGSTSVTFNGSSYQLIDYNFSATFRSSNYSSRSLNGEISVFPSDLVYSAQVRYNQTTLNLQLLATNLSLDPPATGPASLVEPIAFSAVGAVVVFVGMLYGIRRFRKKPATESSPADGKPSYWVD